VISVIMYEGLRHSKILSRDRCDSQVDVNKAWETIRENVKISAKESLGY
jgi:hypothetical protein